MRKQIKAEINVLDRVMHLLEERSVNYLVAQDDNFGNFIEGLYSTVNNIAFSLHKSDGHLSI